MHPSDDTLISLLAGDGSEADRRHLATCARCAAAAAVWSANLADLRATAAADTAVDEREMHRLVTLFRHHRPCQPQRSWLAALLQPAAGAVRGPATDLVEAAAGPYRLAYQLGPGDERGTVAVHGQVTAAAGQTTGAGRVILSQPDGRALVADIDDFGEFHLAAVPPGRYAASWYLEAAAIHLDEVEVGDLVGS